MRRPTPPPQVPRHQAGRCPPGTHVFVTFVEHMVGGLAMHRCVCTRCGLVV